MWVLDCDDNNHSVKVGTKAGDGWRFETKGVGVSGSYTPTRTTRILMMEMEDTE